MPEPFVVDGVWVPRAIVGIRSRYAVPLYLELRRHCFEEPSCFPGVRRLARLVGCAIGTVSALTDQFHVLGIVTKMHDGRRCFYRFAEGTWRQRKSRQTAHCSAGRTERRIPFGDSSDKRRNHKNERVSLDVSRQLKTRNKRVNMIKSLRRWAELSPHLEDDERPHRLRMLERAETSLDAWCSRSQEDKRCLDRLVAMMRSRPLEPACLQSLAQRPVGLRAIGMVLPVWN
jgi:hypothetical protein